jgi:mannosyl-oligosaccharide alpha-1,2-mannosidase
MALLPRRRRPLVIFAACVLLVLWRLAVLTDNAAPPSLSNAPQPHPSRPAEARVSWKTLRPFYPVTHVQGLPSGRPLALPKIQGEFTVETAAEKSIRQERLAAVKASALHAWRGYRKKAWLKDEVMPLSGGNRESFGGWAATLVDGLDTLWIMGLKDEFEEAVKATATIDFTASDSKVLSVFETTIRYLGGLLGAYDITGGKYPVLLSKATELGEMLYWAFDTPNRMPVGFWKWQNASDGTQLPGYSTGIADVGSLSMEFTRLSQLTGDPKYYDAVARITAVFRDAQQNTSIPGLWPVIMNAQRLTFESHGYSLGAMADSMYEYLPKQYMLLGGLENAYKSMFEPALAAAKKHIFFRPMTRNNAAILLAGESRYTPSASQDPTVELKPSSQHLACFAAGMVGISAKLFDRPDDLITARQLADGCIWAYESMASGIMPEIFRVVPCPNITDCTWSDAAWYEGFARLQGMDTTDPKTMATARQRIQELHLPPGFTSIDDAEYKLRPEAIEAVFVLYRLTGDRALQEAAWRMFKAVERCTRTELAHAALVDVAVERPEKADKMESFWLAETLKYFYLVFAEPEVVSLDEWVLNTEAHPFQRPQAT